MLTFIIIIIHLPSFRLPVGYGFVTFDDRNTAQSVLRELNGQKIPNIDDVFIPFYYYYYYYYIFHIYLFITAFIAIYLFIYIYYYYIIFYSIVQRKIVFERIQFFSILYLNFYYNST